MTSRPRTLMEPELMLFSALIQRISVDYPDPEGPIMQITSPFITSKLIPLSTSSVPNDLCTFSSETIGCSDVQLFGSINFII